jgi:hypothetical protein
MSTNAAGSEIVEGGAVGVKTRHRSSAIISKIPFFQIHTLTDAGGESRCVLRKKARLFGQAQGEKFPGRRQIYDPRPPQTSTCGINATGVKSRF